MTLEELRVIIKAETKGYREEIEKLKKQTKSATNVVNQETNKMKKSFTKLKTTIASLAIGAGFLKISKDSTKMAMTVQSSIQQINRLMGDNANKFRKWTKSNALSFNMSQLDAMKYGGTYANLLSSFFGDTNDVMNGTIQLLKASSIIASGTGRTMEDVMERIRSGLLGNTEAIEDLGINVNVGTLEATNAFKRFAGDSSWNQLDFQTQQQIRLFAILEQTSQKFGDSVLNNTGSSLQQFLAILKDIALHIGNAFLPILDIVIPILSSLAMKVREVTAYLSTFFSLLFGKKPKSNLAKETQRTSNSLGGASSSAGKLASNLGKAENNAKKTAKALGNLAGFDDLNVLSSASNPGNDSGSSGSGASTPTGVGGFEWGEQEDVEAPGINTKKLEKSVKKVKSIIKGLKDFLSAHKVPIVSAISGIMAGFAGYKAVANWGTIVKAVTGALAGLGTALTSINPIALAVGVVIAYLTGAFVQLWQTNEEWKNKVIEAWNNVKDIVSAVYESVLVPIFEGIVVLATTVWENGIVPLWNSFVNMVDVISSAILDLWNFLSPYVKQALDYLGPIFSTAFKVLGEVIGNVLSAVMNTATMVFNAVAGAIEWVVSAVANAKDSFTLIIESIKQIFSGLIDFITGIFTLDFELAIQGIIDIFKGLWNGLVGIVKGVWDTILGLFANGGQIFSGVVDGIAEAFKNIVNTMIVGINKVIAWPFKKVNGFLNDIRNIEIPIIGKPFKGLWGKNPIPIPEIPTFAMGGIVDKATLGIFGEAGTEAIVPLENNTGWIKKIAKELRSETDYGTNENATYVINVVLEDGTPLVRKVIKDIKDYERRTGEPVFSY